MQQHPQSLQQQQQLQQQQLIQQQNQQGLQQQQQQQQQHQQNGSIATGQTASLPNSPSSAYAANVAKKVQINGGRFDFQDGGTYCGGWEDRKAHGYGVCTGPKHQGVYAGTWNYGFEVSGVYIWPSGSTFEGQWQNGRRHGVGVEHRGRLIYRGEWTSGNKGRYGVRQSTTSNARYEGTWANGLQDGYGSETYADGGYYQGQWQDGKRKGYGVRTSAPFGLASHYRAKHVHASMSSLRSNENEAEKHRGEDVRGGFVLKARSDEPPVRRNSLGEKSKKGFLSKIRKQRSTGDLEKRGTGASGSIRSTVSTASWISTGSSQSGLTTKSVHTDSNASFTVDEEQLDPTVVETYMGEWNHDKRTGYGISERSDGLKYEGEWCNNKKHGYGTTTFRDGTQEEGKYKNNVLITSQKKKHLFLIRSRKFRERIEAAVSSAQRASKYALQKADIAVSRTQAARDKAKNADTAAEHARIDCEMAVQTAHEFAPDFKPSVLERFERIRMRERYCIPPSDIDVKPKSSGTSATSSPSNQQPDMNKFDSNLQQQTPSDAFHQQHGLQNQPPQNATINRRPSIHPITKQQAVDYSQVPNQQTSSMSMYSQISPQSDLSQHVTQHELSSQTTHNQPNNPSYQFQQQQPPGSGLMGNYVGSHGPGQPNDLYGGGNTSSNSPGMQQNSPTQQQQQYGLQQQQPYGQQQQQQQQQQYNQFQQQQQMHSSVNQNQQSPLQQQPNYYSGYNSNTSDMQSQQQAYLLQNQPIGSNPGAASIRRNSRPVNDSSRPMLGSYNQTSIDYFDHYKRPISRDPSVDRYTRAASRLSGGAPGMESRQNSVDRNVPPAGSTSTGANSSAIGNPVKVTETPERRRSGSVFRGQTPTPATTTGNGTVLTGIGSGGSRGVTPMMSKMNSSNVHAMYASTSQPFEDVLLRQRSLGQDIIPSPLQPKRTESLFMPAKPIAPVGGAAGAAGGKKLKSVPITVSLQRKKSLPDVQELPRSTEAMSREEVSALGSARREEIRRQIENTERLKANPLLYLVSPQVKDWFSRQQLVLLVLAMNVVLAIMFFKMLT